MLSLQAEIWDSSLLSEARYERKGRDSSAAMPLVCVLLPLAAANDAERLRPNAVARVGLAGLRRAGGFELLEGLGAGHGKRFGWFGFSCAARRIQACGT